LNSRAIVYSEHYNCEQLRGHGVDVINAKMTSLFERARTSAPSFLCLDNLDAICSSRREEAEVSYSIL
jgi:AAA+ superfamily predicted ATPase